jgi:hypothetical protein
MQMTSDQLEFAISQYLDGALAPLEAAALEERLARDAEARELFGEYQRLDGVVKNALPEPEVDWSAFSTQLRTRLGEAEAPVKHYQLPFARVTWVAALAASVLIVAGVAMQLMKTSTTTHPGPTPGGHGGGELIVQGPAPEQSTGPATTDVQIGAPTNTADASAGWQSYEALIDRPSRVVIGGVDNPGQDTDAAPY